MRTPRFWQDANLLSSALAPLAWLYGIGAKWDRTHSTPQKANLPVLSVGNVTAGGAGKTPTTIALAALLKSLGHQPHIITRGYGGTARNAQRVAASDDWKKVGDEALLLAEAAPSWVGRQRLASANAAQAAGATIAIADDALQHHALKKDLSLLVIDGPFGIGNARLLPAGPLREPFTEAMARSDAMLIIGDDTHSIATRADGKPVFHATLTPAGGITLHGEKFLAFAGIARPEKLYNTLRALGANLVATQDFPDHHAFTERELETLCATATRHGATPIATAKDAVKFPPSYRGRIRTLPVALKWNDPAAIENWLKSALPAPI